MRTIREGSITILPRPDGKTIDVFTGRGWDRHTVFEVTDRRIRLREGVALSTEDFNAFKQSL